MSTQELPLTLLQLACNLGVGLALTRMAFYTCVQLVEPLSSLRRKSPSCFLWLLGSGFVITSILWSIQLLAKKGFTIPLTSFMTAMLMVLLTAVHVRGKRTVRSIQRTKQIQKQIAIALQKQSQVSVDLVDPQTLNRETLKDVTPQITSTADRVTPVERKLGNLEQASSTLSEVKLRHPLRTKSSAHPNSCHTPESFYLYASPACLTLLGYKPDEVVRHSQKDDKFFHLHRTGLKQSHFNRLNQSEIEPLGYRIHCQGGDYICFKSTTASISHPDPGVVEEIVPVSCDPTNCKQLDEAQRTSCNGTSLLLNPRKSLLFELANQISNSLELAIVLETAVQVIRNFMQIDRCYFSWYRSHESVPYWEVVNEASNSILKSHIGQYPISQMGSLGERLLKQQIVQVDAVETVSEPTLRQFLLDMGYTSLLSIPIATKHGEIGMIACVHTTEPRTWERSEVELLQAVVTQLAITINQAQVYEQARQAAQQAQAKAQELERTLNQLKTTQAQLVQSAKMSSLGQLVAGIAHEINNPVNFIHGNLIYASAYVYDLLGFLRLYQEQYPNPTAAISEQAEVIEYDFLSNDLPKLIHSMQQGTERIRSIVLNLRNFSRLDEAEKKKVNLHEGIDSTLLILQHRLKPKGCHGEIQVFKEYGNLPSITCYPGELNQVFLNILSNAIEAFEHSVGNTQENPSPAIAIRTQLLDRFDSAQNSLSRLTESHSPKNHQSIVIQIVDNGSGMTESVKARIFDPFFTTKPVGRGIGLGLSICYQIVVEHHHGVLTCTSEPGQGTEFWIEIPVIWE